ncbi:tRNA (adenosine(37)-N6)-threonylcarbamoyltransferase complex ATPase subunit type 1 TsaE [Salibacterium aidingense]|uniref:tRNA (adenosine(37)-N6)-threonylcarbamoyltransferase complex ATPase subunit type 1 TsaE n=1 Tax=Salibacterium aidingense TaxID=384933 RepID=UPI0003FB4ACF|nr:tRNA (adenosine(37)-N6)-threonylcarbamoyltransferase complex ATPase subunit type 1 TsaE [Salibacterium aidingense]
MLLEYTSTSPEQTLRTAETIAPYLKGGDILTLDGDLGAGKTHFTKGLARGLHIQEVVNSPTFTIIKEYEGILPLYHMDFYRLDDVEAEEMGLEEYFENNGICVLEWAEKISPILPPERLQITIQRVGENKRNIRLEPVGESFIERCKELENHEDISN